MTQTISIQSRIHRAIDLPFTKVHSDMLAINEQAGFYYVLNETSSRIWDLIASPATVEAVCTQLCQEYNVDADTCQREVLQLLNNLQEAGLIQTEKTPK